MSYKIVSVKKDGSFNKTIIDLYDGTCSLLSAFDMADDCKKLDPRQDYCVVDAIIPNNPSYYKVLYSTFKPKENES